MKGSVGPSGQRGRSKEILSGGFLWLTSVGSRIPPPSVLGDARPVSFLRMVDGDSLPHFGKGIDRVVPSRGLNLFATILKACEEAAGRKGLGLDVLPPLGGGLLEADHRGWLLAAFFSEFVPAGFMIVCVLADGDFLGGSLWAGALDGPVSSQVEYAPATGAHAALYSMRYWVLLFPAGLAEGDV